MLPEWDAILCGMLRRLSPEIRARNRVATHEAIGDSRRRCLTPISARANIRVDRPAGLGLTARVIPIIAVLGALYLLVKLIKVMRGPCAPLPWTAMIGITR